MRGSYVKSIERINDFASTLCPSQIVVHEPHASGRPVGEAVPNDRLFHFIPREQARSDGGYVSFSNDTIDGWHYYIQDYMGNNRMVVNSDGMIEQVTHYYPYGGVIGDISTNENVQKYKFEGKELDRTFGLDNYDIHARQYFAMAPMWDRIDPLTEENPQYSPYSYCMGDPVNYGDYNGCDTTVVNFIEGKWIISTPIISEGDDVFIIKDGDNETILTNTEGEYGNRMSIVYLESDQFQNFGIYQLSGTKTCGYVLQPPGAPSSDHNEKHRSISGTYQTGLGTGERWPNYVSVNNDQLYDGKGLRVHYGSSANASTNCILISDLYIKNSQGRVFFDLNKSRNAVESYFNYLGGKRLYDANGKPLRKTTHPKTGRQVDVYTWKKIPISTITILN